MMTQKRPELLGEFVARETAEAMLQRVNAYSMKRGLKNAQVTASYLDRERQQLTKAIMEYKTPREMVAFMRGLAGHPETVPEDDELVKIMSQAAKKRVEVYHRLVKSWVKDNLVLPTRKLGEKVKFTWQGKPESGIISKIEPETAQYLVFCEHLGHVRVGVGVQGIYVNYEDVK